MTLAQQYQQTLDDPKDFSVLKQAIAISGFSAAGWFHFSVIFPDGSVWGGSFSLTTLFATAFHE